MRWIFVILCLLFSLPCFAQSPVGKREAVEMIEKGNFAYEVADYESALNYYQRAFRAAPDSRILYRIGLTFEHLGNFQRAREHLELFLQQERTHENAARIRKKVEELRQAEAAQSFLIVRSMPEGGEVYLGDLEAAGVSPVRLPVHPGAHVIRVELGENWEERQVMIGRGETVTEVFEFAPTVEEESILVAETETEIPVEEPLVQLEEPLSMSHVSFRPPAALNALGWAAVIGGFWCGVAGIIIGDGRVIAGGLGIMGLGVYSVFIHDWTNRLPDAPKPEDAGARSLEFRIQF